MTTAPDMAVTLARVEMKIDTLVKSASDHETRLRDLEATSRSNRALAMTIANAVLTVITTAMAGSSVIG